MGNTTAPSSHRGALHAPTPRIVFGLMIAWSANEPHRIGEVALLDGAPPFVIGRSGDAISQTPFQRQRWSQTVITGGLGHASVSRKQLEVVARGDAIEAHNVGRVEMLVNGELKASASVRVGDVIEIRGRYIFLVVKRDLAVVRDSIDEIVHPFGEADAFGIVGESAEAWELRDAITFSALAKPHVLVVGESGTGKDACARAIHTVSPRAAGKFIARNVATLPAELASAELFGNLRNYPNVGMVERVGVIGEADGGTLFLDEIGETSHAIQAQLLRFLDSGEYHRLGDANARRADVRVIAATNRDLGELKHDLVARFTLRVALPSLDARIEDVPLLVRHLVKRATKREMKIDSAFMTALLRRSYPTNVRELDAILWRAIAAAKGETLAMPLEAQAAKPSVEESAEARRIRSILDEHRWNVTRAAESLGISRFALARLVKKHLHQ